MKKKILIDATTVIDKVDGLSTYIINLIKNLPKESFDIFDYSVLIQPGLKRPEFISLLQDNKYTVIEKKIAPIGPKREWHMFWFLQKHRKSFDLFHSTSNQYPLILRNGLATVHDISYRKYFDTPWWSLKIIPRYMSFIVWSSLFKSTAVIAVSNATKNTLVSSYRLNDKIKNKIQVIYEGWEHLQSENDEMLKDEVISQFENYLFYVGTTRIHKNMKNLLKAFNIAKTNLPPHIKLVVSGNDSYLNEEDKKSIEMINAEHKRIIFTGFVSKNELEQLFRKADAFIFPSLSEG